MDSLFEHPLIQTVRSVIPQGVTAHLVGGAVRDQLLGNKIVDFDFVVSADALKIARKVANLLNAAYYPLDSTRQYGRVIWAAPDGDRIKLDFALQAGNSIEEDLRRRDFTINALGVDLSAPEKLIDPLQGAQDLLAKRLRACSQKAFEDDPLRVVRGIRFALSLGFRIDPLSWNLMKEASSLLTAISAERLNEELFRLFHSGSVASGIRLLDRVGALPFTFPELIALKGVQQSSPHRQDVYQHTLEVVTRLEEILAVLAPVFDEERQANLVMGMALLRLGRFRAQIGEYLDQRFTPDRQRRALLFLAALYHDSGKVSSSSQDDKGEWHFYGHEQISAQLCESRLRSLALSNDEIEWTKKVVLYHMRPILLAKDEHPPSRRAVYRFFRQSGEAGVGVCLLSLADVLGIYGYTLPPMQWSRHLDVIRQLLGAWWEEKPPIISLPPLLDGNELMRQFDLQPGPIVGKILEGIREAQAAGEVQDKTAALLLAERMIAAEQGRSGKSLGEQDLEDG